MSRKINIVVLGCANIAERFIMPSLKELSDNFNLVGIASRAKVKADEFANRFETQAYYSYKSILEHDELDAVYIPLPNSLHYEWIKKSLEKNLHVLVEKSMSCNYDEVLELNNIAKEKNLVLIENFQFRFHSQLKYIKDLVDSGKIGRLRNIRSSFGFPPFSDKGNIRYSKELGGGALLDAGAYTLKISQIFMGDDISVDTSHLKFDKDNHIDIYGSASLSQNNGDIVSQVSFGFDNYYQCNIELWGSKGKIYTNRIFTPPPGYTPLIELETQDGKDIIQLEKDNHFLNMLKYFYNKIVTKDSMENEYKDNINQARLINEIKGN
jgi:dTDP-3,4-didehydro-2,6-dideoxy-alpha-D-glucose 3-reductase